MQWFGMAGDASAHGLRVYWCVMIVMNIIIINKNECSV